MINLNCEQCGMINRLTDESCRDCGAELKHNAVSFHPAAPEYQMPQQLEYQMPQQARTEGTEAQAGEFESHIKIGPFDNIGAVLSPTIDLFKDNIWLITKVVFVLFAPFEIFKALSFKPGEADWQFGAGVFLLSLFCKALVAPALIYALVLVMRTGKAPSLSEAYRWGLGRLGKLVACVLMAWILQLLGFVCLIIPGIILGLAFELIYPIATLENLGPGETLKRSYRLTDGYRWRILGVTIVLGLLCSVVNLPVGFVLTMMATNGIHFWPLEAALALVTDIVYAASTVLSLVIYFSILNTPAAGKEEANWPYDKPL